MHVSSITLLDTLEHGWSSKLGKQAYAEIKLFRLFFFLWPITSLATQSMLLNNKTGLDQTKSMFGGIFVFTNPSSVSPPPSGVLRKDLQSMCLLSSALLDFKSKCCKWCGVPVHCHSGIVWGDSLIKTLWTHCSTSQVLTVLKEWWYQLLHLHCVGTVLAAQCTRDIYSH